MRHLPSEEQRDLCSWFDEARSSSQKSSRGWVVFGSLHHNYPYITNFSLEFYAPPAEHQLSICTTKQYGHLEVPSGPASNRNSLCTFPLESHSLPRKGPDAATLEEVIR